MSLDAKIIDDINELQFIAWSFQWWDVRTGIVLDNFSVMERKTKRHKFQVISNWSRLDRRNNRIEKPVVPTKVIEKAIKAIQSQIKYEASDGK